MTNAAAATTFHRLRISGLMAQPTREQPRRYVRVVVTLAASGRRAHKEGPMVPSSLRTWFVIHFLADVLFALPLFLAPRWTLSLLGWPAVDPLATRLVAAAPFAVGIQSRLRSCGGAAAYLDLLRHKIIS